MSFEHTDDKRVLERNLAKGSLSKKEYDKKKASLVDVADNAEWFNPLADPNEELKRARAAAENQPAQPADKDSNSGKRASETASMAATAATSTTDPAAY